MQYAVGVSAKKVKPMQWGTQYAVGVSAKKVKPMQWGTQYAVGVSAKRPTPTVDLAYMGGGGPLPLVQKGQTPCSGCAVHSRYTVRSRC